ncbi:MAG TPA: serine/threonine-protein kinase, partial [Polyangia bacterium]|nr:serine/threonine-protein kinase [Polyangia bacterium]
MKFGRYRLIERIGEGGMADVYRAEVLGPKGFSRQLAIKRIHTLFAREIDFINMLGTEARVTALLNHPAIVQVYEFGHVEDELYLAMELAEGPDLGRLLMAAEERKIAMPVGVACYIIGQLADALAYAHALHDGEGRPLNIIHRDVTPSNVVISHVGGVKLLDFGIARAAEHVRNERTRTGVLKGKISYLSPEQIDAQEIDHRTDEFALGIVFYECLTLARPYKGVIRQENLAAPSTLRPDVDTEVDAVVMKMLSAAPGDRFADCAEVATALSPLSRRLGGDALALRDWLTTLGPLPSKAEPMPSEPVEPTRPVETVPAVRRNQAGSSVTDPSGEIRGVEPAQPRMRPATWLMLAATVGLAIGVTSYFWMRAPAIVPATPSIGPVVASAPTGATQQPLRPTIVAPAVAQNPTPNVAAPPPVAPPATRPPVVE